MGEMINKMVVKELMYYLGVFYKSYQKSMTGKELSEQEVSEAAMYVEISTKLFVN